MDNLFENKKIKAFVTLVIIIVVLVFMIKDQKENVNKSLKELETITSTLLNKKYSVDKINIEVDGILVEFNNDNDNGVLVKLSGRPKASYEVYEENGELFIKFNKTKCEGTCLHEEKVVLSVPYNFPVELNVVSYKGNLNISNITLKNSNISLDKGNINIDSLSLVSDSSISSKEGNIKIKSALDMNINGSTKNGSVNINSNNRDASVNLEVSSDNGNIDIN